MATANYTAIDLFCGAGGFSLGLSWAGFRVAAALDNDIESRKTYELNFGLAPIEKDAALTTPDEILAAAQLSAGECSLVVGGPPCQGFSVQRRGDRDDPRNSLVKTFVDTVLRIRPRFFIIENVG